MSTLVDEPTAAQIDALKRICSPLPDDWCYPFIRKPCLVVLQSARGHLFVGHSEQDKQEDVTKRVADGLAGKRIVYVARSFFALTEEEFQNITKDSVKDVRDAITKFEALNPIKYTGLRLLQKVAQPEKLAKKLEEMKLAKKMEVTPLYAVCCKGSQFVATTRDTDGRLAISRFDQVLHFFSSIL